MDQQAIQQRWDGIRSRVKEQWPQLSDEDLSLIDGDSQKLVALVHQKSGENLTDIEESIDRIAAESEGLLTRVAMSTRTAVSNAQEQVRQPLAQAYEVVEEQVRSSPLSAALLAFAVGLIGGICIGRSLLPEPPPRSWWERKYYG